MVRPYNPNETTSEWFYDTNCKRPLGRDAGACDRGSPWRPAPLIGNRWPQQPSDTVAAGDVSTATNPITIGTLQGECCLALGH